MVRKPRHLTPLDPAAEKALGLTWGKPPENAARFPNHDQLSGQFDAEPAGLSRHKSLQIVKIRQPLRDSPLVACLVLAAHQHMRAALALGGEFDIGAALSDRVLDMAAIDLTRLEAPDLLVTT